MKILENITHQQIGMQLRHAIDCMTANTRQMGHADVTTTMLIDQ